MLPQVAGARSLGREDVVDSLRILAGEKTVCEHATRVHHLAHAAVRARRLKEKRDVGRTRHAALDGGDEAAVS